MTRCTRCVLPADYRGIRFDADGVCNYCHTWDEVRARLTDFERLGALRADRVARARAAGARYDCLVGLSGGKDSSFVLMDAVRHGLRPLAFTFDNGFLTDDARRNITRVVEALGVDHVFYVVPWELQRQFYEQALRWFGSPCPACSYSGYALMLKAAFERGIPLVIHGRSRSQMFRELLPGSPDAFLPFVRDNLAPYDAERLKTTNDRARRRLERFVRLAFRDRGVRERFYEAFFPPLDAWAAAAEVPEFLAWFLYEPYDERRVMDRLEAELDWKRPADGELLTHHDCAVHDAAAALYGQIFGDAALSFELSVLIREGQMTRGEAMERLERELRGLALDSPAVVASTGVLTERVGVGLDELPAVVRRARRRHHRHDKILQWRNRLRRPHLDI